MGHVHARPVGPNVQNAEQLTLDTVRDVLFKSKKRWPSPTNSFLLSDAMAFNNAAPVNAVGT